MLTLTTESLQKPYLKSKSSERECRNGHQSIVPKKNIPKDYPLSWNRRWAGLINTSRPNHVRSPTNIPPNVWTAWQNNVNMAFQKIFHLCTRWNLFVNSSEHIDQFRARLNLAKLVFVDPCEHTDQASLALNSLE